MQKLILSSLLVFSLALIAFGQKNTITNFELEKYRQKRVEADADYERKVQSGVVPPKAELDRREQERQKFIAEYSQKAALARNQAENYWQAQGYALRTEIAAVEAEANYVRARIGEIPEPQVFYSVGYLPYGFGGIGFGNFGGVGFPQYPVNGSNNLRISNAQIGGTVTVGRSPRATIGVNLGQTTISQNGSLTATATTLNAPQTNLYFGGIPYQPGILTAPFTLPTLQNLTREELISRLRLLEQTRAGLYARYEVLQDEARRNDVKID